MEFLKLDMGPMSLISAPGVLREQEGTLYLGNIPNALKIVPGETHKFWAILNCTDDPELDKLNSDGEFEVKRLNQWDGEEYPPAKISDGIKFVEDHMKTSSGVLICCHAGMSRSPGMVLAYLLHLGYIYSDSIRIIRKARPFIQIHPSVDRSIRKYFNLAPKTIADLIGG